MRIKTLVGSGDRIALFTLPFVGVGMALNVAYPAVFRVGGPPAPLRAVSIVLLIVGVATWVWSVVLILSKVSRGELITGGPYALARHPVHERLALGPSFGRPSFGRIPPEHVAGRRDRHRHVRRLEDVRAGGGGVPREGLRRRHGVPEARQGRWL